MTVRFPGSGHPFDYKDILLGICLVFLTFGSVTLAAASGHAVLAGLSAVAFVMGDGFLGMFLFRPQDEEE